MNLTNLYVAYGMTWAIHLGYLGYLAVRFARVRKLSADSRLHANHPVHRN